MDQLESALNATDDGKMIRTFGTVDYVIFSLSLLLSLFIGVFAGAHDWARAKMEWAGTMRNITGLRDQLVGGGDMNPFLVALSMLASFLSAPFLLGTPAEIYMFGSMYASIMISYLFAAPLTAHLFVPVFHRQQMTSAYEFIEKRFNGWIRLLGSLLFVLMMLLYMAVVVYAPAAAFAQVTGLPTAASIMGVGIICTMYTAFGGMKAVVLTDAIQMAIILAGMLALIIQGTIEAGGPAEVVRKVSEGGRVQTDSLSLDPRVRHTWWTQTIGGTFITLSLTATNQAMIQRYLSIKTTRRAQYSTYFALVFQELYLALVVIVGFVMFAYYYRCDPVITQRIASKDQLVPVFVMDSLGTIYGLPGLFSASVFAASLSTVSSGVNALAAVVISDIIHPLYERKHLRKMRDTFSARLTKGLSLVFGLVTVSLAFAAPLLGSTLLQIAIMVFGMVGGPLLGLFVLAIFFPMANEWGALAGTLGSLLCTSWISIGSIAYPNYPQPMPLYADKCPFWTNATQTLRPTPPDDGFTVKDIYSISYMWYSLLSLIVALLIGLPVSLCTGGNRDKKEFDANLYFAYHRKCTPCFNACRCERCFPIDDTEEILDTKLYDTSLAVKHQSVDSVFSMYAENPLYDTSLAVKRQSVDSVFSMYAENPGLAKRTSIAIQLGSTGLISGHLTHRAPDTVFSISHPPDTLAEIAEEEDEEPAAAGLSNPGYSTFGVHDVTAAEHGSHDEHDVTDSAQRHGAGMMSTEL